MHGYICRAGSNPASDASKNNIDYGQNYQIVPNGLTVTFQNKDFSIRQRVVSVPSRFRNWSFKAFAFAVSVKRVWSSFLKGGMPLESCLECLSSE